MVPAYSYERVCSELGNSFHGRYHGDVRMVGLLFARPASPLAVSEILPNLNYYHHRSGNHIDFFCGGYGQYWENWRDEFPDQCVVSRGGSVDWLYSARKFNAFRIEPSAAGQANGCHAPLHIQGRWQSPFQRRRLLQGIGQSPSTPCQDCCGPPRSPGA